jgi:hypothetical protein
MLGCHHKVSFQTALDVLQAARQRVATDLPTALNVPNFEEPFLSRSREEKTPDLVSVL